MKTLIIGLGNPILGDDSIGWVVAEEVRKKVLDKEIEVDTAALGGISLMERLIGYDHVILIDAIETGQFPVGTVNSFPIENLANPMAGHSASTHDTTLMTALQVGRQLQAHLPTTVMVVAVETQITYEFSEDLSPEAAKAAAAAVRQVLDLLAGLPGSTAASSADMTNRTSNLL
ncbi:MAG: hydrogenase maturation protease [Anaerolineales bacterium]|nr:hydrogenase maturation protease [Anaerolineales bacterium]